MKTTPTRPQTKQVMVCRDGRTMEPDFVVAGDVGGFTSGQVVFAASDGSLTSSSGLTYNSATGALTLSNTSAVHTINSTIAATSSTGAVVIGSATDFVNLGAGLIYAQVSGGGGMTFKTTSSANGIVLTMDRASNARQTTIQHTLAGVLEWVEGVGFSNGGSASTDFAWGTSTSLASALMKLSTAGVLTLSGTTASTSPTTGTVVVAGGVGITKDLFVAGNTWFQPSGTTANLFLQNSTTGYSVAGDHGFNLQMSGLNMAFNNLEAGSISYFTSGIERMRIGSDGNLSLFAAGGSFGGGVLVAYLHNASTVPTSNPANGGVLYCDAGALKYRGSSGTVTTLGPA